MDPKSPTHLLLLILGLTVLVMAQQDLILCEREDKLLKDEQVCPNNWICPSNVSCGTQILCRCKRGYSQCKKKGIIYCRDINECNDGSYNCSDHSTCKNTDGGYFCKCFTGFQRGNQTEFCPSKDKENSCTDINECSISPDVCGSNGVCYNTLGSYYCNCRTGFTSISNTCVDNKVKDKCQLSSSQLKQKEKCDAMNQTDTACFLLQTTFNIFNSSCHSYSNKSKEEAKKQLQQDTEELNRKLNIINTVSSTAGGRETGRVISTILNNVETIMLKSFFDAPRDQTINQSQLSVSMKVSRDFCTPGVVSYPVSLNGNSMEVPCTDRDRDGSIFIVYKNLESTIKGNILSSSGLEDNNTAFVNSRVITGAITNNLTSHVTFTLTLLQALKSHHRLICVFWDPKRNGWSEDGCSIGSSTFNGTHTTCTFNHLSSFAVIMAPLGLEDNNVLTIISKIGLSLSILCLVMSLLTFIFCRSLRSAHMSVLIAMCTCLFLGQFLFLVGIVKTHYKVLCALIAGGLHFFFLCAFCWMSIESVLLFMTVRNLRAVNYMTSRRSNFPVMCLLGFGIPVVIVGISAAIQPDGYGTERYCWLRPRSTIWSFIGPVAVFIIANTILLIITVKLLRSRLASLNMNVSTLKNTRLLVFKALAQLFILGSTWAIGFFQFGSGSLVISYLFTICNSLQGVYIFLVHCIFNHQVIQEYRRVFSRAGGHRKRLTDDSTPHTGTKSINLTEISKPVSEQSSESEKKVNWK